MAQMNHLEYIEYLFHEREKNGLEDLKKARKHLVLEQFETTQL